MRTRTIVRGAAVVAITGVLTGLGVTAAQAAAPVDAQASSAVAGDTMQARYSERVTLHNQLEPGVTMTLVEVGGGKDEGKPFLGSAMAYGESQAFEVQWLFGYTNAIDATYALSDDRGYYEGTVTVRMEMGTMRVPRTSIVDQASRASVIDFSLGGDPVIRR